MKVLVTGGAGYIGSVTTKLLLDRGHEVLVFDNLERGHRRALDERASFACGDLRAGDGSEIDAAVGDFRPEAVMHFAAYALVGESMAEPEKYFRNNVLGGYHLAEAARRHQVSKFIFSSTCATYGNPDTVPMTEDLCQRPANPYGESKLMCERILDWYSRIHGLECVFLRYFNASGAAGRLGEDHDPETHLIPNLLKVALGQRDIFTVFGDDYDTPDGTCIRDYIHILDLAAAHELALKPGLRGAFNLGNGNGYSVREVLECARAVTGHRIPADTGPRRPGDPPRLIASAVRARKLLGWKPEHAALNTIVADAWDWHRRHPGGYDS